MKSELKNKIKSELENCLEDANFSSVAELINESLIFIDQSALPVSGVS